MKASPAESLIPLYLILLSGGRLKGETRLQKLVFIFQSKMRGGVDYTFLKSWYGPFSPKLSGITQNLSSLGILEVREGKTKTGFTVTQYKLTPMGETFLKYSLKERFLSAETIHKLEATYREYGKLQLLDLLTRVYHEHPTWATKSVLRKSIFPETPLGSQRHPI